MNDFTTAAELYFNPNKTITIADVEDVNFRIPDLPKAPETAYRSDADSKRTIKEMDDLLDEEKFIIKEAIERSKSKIGDAEEYLIVSLPVVSRSYHKLKHNRGKNYETIDQLMRRRAFFLQNRGIAQVKKGKDGLTWIYISRRTLADLAAETRRRIEADRERNIDLIRSLCKIPTPPKTSKKRDPLAMPKNATQERLTAIKLAMGIKGKMNNVDRAEFARHFERYNDRLTDKIIALLDNKTGELIGSEYSTRFNDTKKAAIALKKYEYAHDMSLRDYWRASLLTLTTDPKRYDSLWDANRSLAESWNIFMTWLTKRNKGTRPEYLATYEYTKSGLIHVHAIVFLPWIADKKEITKEWERIGHGTINDVRSLKRERVKDRVVWKWAKKRPYGSTAANGGDYLKKYLLKAYLAKTDKYDNQATVQSLYWVFNKRFWTCSRRLLPPPEYLELPKDAKTEIEESEVKEESGYSFFKILAADEYDRDTTEVGQVLITDTGHEVRLIYKRDSKAERAARLTDDAEGEPDD